MEQNLTFDRLIAMHRNKYDYVESPENTLQFAYGDRRYVKMTYELFNADDILVKKTLEEINLDLRRGDFTNLMLLSSDLLSVIVIHFLNPDKSIRELASRTMREICNTELGRSQVIENAYVHDLIVLISDEVKEIRENAYQSMLNLVEFLTGKDHFLLSEALVALVDKLVDESLDGIKIMAMELIYSVLEAEQGTDQILKTPGIERLTVLLDHKVTKIRTLAALNLASLSFLNVGKQAIIEQGCVKNLCKRLEDSESEVREAASLALSSLAQKNDCKHQIMDYKYFEKIIDLLNDESEQTRLNIVQLISSVAEHPVAREVAHSCLDKLKQLREDPNNEYLHTYIDMTVDVICWKP